MKKRILSLVVAMTMMLSFMPVIARAATSGTCGDNLTWTLDDNGTLTISGTGDMTDWSYNRTPWYSNRDIKTVVINPGVTTIGNCAFYDCFQLQTIEIPDSVINIGSSAFHNCYKLQNVKMSNNITTIGEGAFCYCSNLQNIELPQKLVTICKNVFEGCSQLQSIEIPANVADIDIEAETFECSALKNITVNENNKHYSSIDGVLFNKDKTELIRYPEGNTQESYVIPNSVKRIGNNAFYYSKLTSVNISNSVEIIGESAFEDCHNLTNITIGHSVTTIGFCAFWNCRSLTSIDIPNSVTAIEQGAFVFCYGLTNVKIPDSVATMGNGVFADCYDLVSVEIGNGVTTISEKMFEDCSSLTSIKIGNSVTSIEYGAFYECPKLSKVEIPANVTNIDDGAFVLCYGLTNITVDKNNKNYSSNNGVLFNKDKTELIKYPDGISEPFYIIPNGVITIGESAFFGHDYLTSIEIPNSIESIKFHAFGCCYELTDVYYTGSEEEWGNIIIGYNDGLNRATIHYNSKMPMGTFGNTNSTSNGAPIITSAKIGSTNLFTDKLNIDKDSTASYSIEGTVDANGCEDVHLYITQGSKNSIEIPLDACKDIQVGKEFSAGSPIYMTAIDKKTGKSTSKRTTLSIVGDGMFDGSLSNGAIKLIENFGVDVPDDVPVLGGQTFGLSLGSVSSEVEIDGNEFKVSVGTDFLEGKKGSDGKWKKEDWEGFKKGFKSAKENMRHNANAYKYLKNIAPKGTKLEMSKGVGGTANVTGYIEGYVDDTGIHPTEGGIIVSAEIKYTYKGMVVVVVVPLYYEIGAGGELTFVGGVKDLVPGNGLQGVWTGSITPAVFFEVGSGLGVPYIFTVGASGKVKAELEIALNKVYQKLDITGTAKFKLTGPLGIPTYEKPFAEGTFHVFETGNKNTLLGKVGLYSVDKADDNPYSSIDIDAPITLTDHSASTQEWVGSIENAELAAVDYTNQEVKVLEENSYEGIAPVLSDMNGKNVIAWVTDNKDRANGDKNMLVYSVEENGSWAEPAAVHDDGFADSTPSMKDGYIVWQKVTSNITSDMSMRDLGKVCEIYLAKWNGNGFDTPVRITNNALLDQAPMLSVSGGKATVVWVQNSDNNFMGTTGENSIMSYTDNTVKTEQTVSNAITNMSTAYIDGVLNIAYETDSDNDLSTLEDREIYNIANGSVSRITNNSAADTHPVYGEMNEDTVLFYYSDGKIVYNKNGAENTVIENNVTTDQFTVISNGENTAVLWTTVQDGSAELHGALYDGSVWSEDVQVSDLGKRVKFPSAVMQSDGSIFAAFNRTEKVPNEYYYDDGQADLCTIKITPSYDLELTDVYFDEENMQVYATVKNNGERNIDSYTISLNDNGVNAQKTITEPLKAGEIADVEIAYNKPDDLSSRKVMLSVSLISGEEYDVDNNSAEFSIGNPDVAVNNVVINEDETKVTADVSNIGYSIAKDVTVSLREGSSSGTVLEKQTVTLSANESNNVEFDINKDNIHFYKPSTQLYITAEYASDEVSLGNNDGYVIVMSKSGMADYQAEILNYSEIDGKYMINSIARNNTDMAISCVMYSAVYSSDGTLKACGTVKADIDADNDTGVDITVPCTIETGDTIKTFMWADNMTPLAKAGELVIE